MQKYKNLHSKSSKKILIGAVVIVIALVIAGFWHFKTDNKPSSSASMSQSKPPAATGKGVANVPKPVPTTDVPGGSTGSNVSPTPTLVAPSDGTFVSNHGSDYHPVLSDSNEESTCTTTPSANCQVVFTNGDTTVSLPAEQTTTSRQSQNATVSWSWTPAGIGLTTGTWTITAKATLNGQTKTVQDSLKLVVQ